MTGPERHDTKEDDMPDDNEDFDPRTALLDLLLQKVQQDQYPSTTMMDLIEELLVAPDDVRRYALVLMDKIMGDTYPSIDMMDRARHLSVG